MLSELGKVGRFQLFMSPVGPLIVHRLSYERGLICHKCQLWGNTGHPGLCQNSFTVTWRKHPLVPA